MWVTIPANHVSFNFCRYFSDLSKVRGNGEAQERINYTELIEKLLETNFLGKKNSEISDFN